jgi:DNA-binding MarR family transcriptional regulator
MRKSRPKGVGKALERVLLGEEEEGRASRTSPLMSPVRQKLFSFLCKHPGSSVKAIASGNDISQSTAAWHLRQLMEAGYVSQNRFRRRVTYYPTGLVDPSESELLVLLNNDTAKDLFLTILHSPGLTQRELAKAIGISDQSVQRLVRRMESHDIISRTTDGRYVRYFPSDGLKKAKDRNYRREKEFIKKLLRRLEADGLQPRVLRQSNAETKVEIQRSRSKAVLDLSADPFSTVLE